MNDQEGSVEQWRAARQGIEERGRRERERGRWAGYHRVVGTPVVSDWDRIQWKLDMTDPKSGDWFRRFGEISDLDLPRSWDFMYDLNDTIFELDLLNEKLERGWPW